MKQSLLTVLISVLLLYTSDIIAQDITCANLINEVYKDSEIIKPNSTNNPTVNYAKPNTQILDVRYVNDFVSGGGSNHYCNTVTDCTDGSVSLIYQVYYPNTAYSETKKLPAVILFHAGGFSDCTNFNTTEMQTYCTEFAKRGFVAFNVEYRRGKEEDSVSKYTSASRFLAMYRCIQDARGAIRTIVSRELNNVTPYRIDVQSIFLGGLSSGSVMAIAAGYYNSTMINQIFPSVSSYLGDIDGDNYLGNASEGSYTIKGVLDLWGAAHLPLNFASNPAGFFSQNSKRPSLIAFHGGSDGVINIDSSNLFFSPSTSRYRSESLCVNGTYTLPDNGANKSDLKLYGSQGFYKILKTSLNIPCELYIDCDMKHGLDEATSDFGLANGDASAVSVKDVQVYIVQRAATFFQYVMNPNFPYTLTHTRFVDCLNSRYGCNSDSATTCSDMAVTGTFYADADHDGYGNPVHSIQACPAPAGYVANNADCDDTDPNIHPGAIEVCDGKDNNCDGQIDEGVTSTFYADADGDGYGNPASSVQACSAPAGYVANNTDCDDTDPNIHPGATEVCDGKDNNCDGQIDEGILTTFYWDADGDGYGNPANSVQACSAPAGYVANNTDCDDTDPSIHPDATEVCDGKDNNCDGQIDEGVTSTFYADADHDGYGNPNSSIKACTPPAGYVSNNGDCNDNDPAISPAAVEVCGNKIDDNCNGLADEQPCYVCQNATNLSTTNITCNSAKLNWVSISNPLQWQVQYKINNKTAKWVDILPFPTGDIRSVTINSLLSNKGYVWHIRAKCGKTWTSYSNSISFKTATTCISSVNVSTINKNEISNATLKLYPNPTKGQFVVGLHVTDKINAKAKIQLIDMTGKTVQTENAEVNSGSLQKTISISSNLTKGIYMVRILVNDKIYKTQLVYAK